MEIVELEGGHLGSGVGGDPGFPGTRGKHRNRSSRPGPTWAAAPSGRPVVGAGGGGLASRFRGPGRRLPAPGPSLGSWLPSARGPPSSRKSAWPCRWGVGGGAGSPERRRLRGRGRCAGQRAARLPGPRLRTSRFRVVLGLAEGGASAGACPSPWGWAWALPFQVIPFSSGSSTTPSSCPDPSSLRRRTLASSWPPWGGSRITSRKAAGSRPGGVTLLSSLGAGEVTDS